MSSHVMHSESSAPRVDPNVHVLSSRSVLKIGATRAPSSATIGDMFWHPRSWLRSMSQVSSQTTNYHKPPVSPPVHVAQGAVPAHDHIDRSDEEPDVVWWPSGRHCALLKLLEMQGVPNRRITLTAHATKKLWAIGRT